MTPQLIVGIVGSVVCGLGVASDVITTELAYRRGDAEANPILVQLKITTPIRAALFGTAVITAGILLSLFTPYVGAAFAFGLGIGGAVQALKTIKIL